MSYIKDISLPNSCGYTPLMAACGPFVVAVMVPVVCQSYSPIPLDVIGHSHANNRSERQARQIRNSVIGRVNTPVQSENCR